jgi:hypothetical protein
VKRRNPLMKLFVLFQLVKYTNGVQSSGENTDFGYQQTHYKGRSVKRYDAYIYVNTFVTSTSSSMFLPEPFNFIKTSRFVMTLENLLNVLN